MNVLNGLYSPSHFLRLKNYSDVTVTSFDKNMTFDFPSAASTQTFLIQNSTGASDTGVTLDLNGSLDCAGTGNFDLALTAKNGVLVPVNKYLVSIKPNPDTGIYYNSTTSSIEFHRDGAMRHQFNLSIGGNSGDTIFTDGTRQFKWNSDDGSIILTGGTKNMRFDPDDGSILCDLGSLNLKVRLNDPAFVAQADQDVGLWFKGSPSRFAFTNTTATEVLTINAVTGTTMIGNSLTIGLGEAGVDYSVTFDGNTNDGLFLWIEGSDYFQFADDILMISTEKIMFRDSAINIQSSVDGRLDINSDGVIALVGGLGLKAAVKTSAYTAVSDDTVLFGDTDGGAFTITLGALSSFDGKIYYIKNIGTSGNNLTVAAAGTDKIDGSGTAVLADMEAITIQANNAQTNWFII